MVFPLPLLLDTATVALPATKAQQKILTTILHKILILLRNLMYKIYHRSLKDLIKNFKILSDYGARFFIFWSDSEQILSRSFLIYIHFLDIVIITFIRYVQELNNFLQEVDRPPVLEYWSGTCNYLIRSRQLCSRT